MDQDHVVLVIIIIIARLICQYTHKIIIIKIKLSCATNPKDKNNLVIVYNATVISRGVEPMFL